MNKQIKEIMNDTGSKELVMKILAELNGESYADARLILKVVNYFLVQHSYVDKDLAQSEIEGEGNG